MLRRLFTIFSALSLLLCIGGLVFGVWGFREPNDVRFEWTGRHHTACVLSDRGSMALVVADGWPDGAWANRPDVTSANLIPLTINSFVLIDTTLQRVVISDGAVSGTVTFRGVRTNIIFATMFTLAAPIAWCVWKVRGRARRGLCFVCGYDLRATPARCQECGRVQPGDRLAAE